MISLAPLLIIKTTNRNCLCLTAQGDDQIKDAKSNSVMFFFFFFGLAHPFFLGVVTNMCLWLCLVTGVFIKC